MLLRGKSKEPTDHSVTPPGPSYMSNDQFGELGLSSLLFVVTGKAQGLEK